MQPLNDRLFTPYADGCTVCGRLPNVSVHATYLPSGKAINQWLCPECSHAWQTASEPACRVSNGSGWSGHLRDNAARCWDCESVASDDLVRTRLRRIGDGWLALAEVQDWLDGRMSPVACSLPAGATADLPVAITNTEGRLS